MKQKTVTVEHGTSILIFMPTVTTGLTGISRLQSVSLKVAHCLDIVLQQENLKEKKFISPLTNPYVMSAEVRHLICTKEY